MEREREREQEHETEQPPEPEITLPPDWEQESARPPETK